MRRKGWKRYVALALSVAMVNACGIALPSSVDAATGASTEDGTMDFVAPSRVSVHDPSIVKADGTYYLFGTHMADAKSQDLIQWTQINLDWNARGGDSWKQDSVYGDVLENLAESFAWAGYDDGDCIGGGLGVWAPDVLYNPYYAWEDGAKGAYMLYYSASSTWRRSCIGYAVSKHVEGPYQHVDTVVYSGFTKHGKPDKGIASDKSDSARNTKWDNDYLNLSELIAAGELSGISENWFSANGDWNHNYAPNAIDPTVFFGKDGRLYMVYGSWSGGLFIHELDKATGAVKYPGTDSTKPASGNWTDRYFGTHIAGGNHQSGEGGYILYDPGTDYYYLYETYGGLLSGGGYNMRLFRSKEVYGPYLDAAGNNAKDSGSNNDRYGIKLIGNYQFQGQPGYRAAGHNSALIDEDGRQFLFYHQRFDVPGNQHEGHQVRVRQQYRNEDGWPVASVYEYQGEAAAHYEREEIIGSYELIDHGTATNGEMITPKTIDLCEDGTVIGAVSGTWEKSTGAGKAYDYITLNWDGVTYKGVLCKQRNEASPAKEVMTFSAIGSNNTCLWGSEKTEEASLQESLVYGFDFETQPSSGAVYPTKASKGTNKAFLTGTASVVKDSVRGNVLKVQNTQGAKKKNYLHLPFDTFSTVTDRGFTVSMWVKLGEGNGKQSALFEANSGNSNSVYPMTRVSADLAPRINANAYVNVSPYGWDTDGWRHIAYSVSPEGVKLYVNGNVVRSVSKDLGSCFDASLPKCIQKAVDVSVGSGLANDEEDIRDAMFDDVSVYNAALTAKQVRQVYEADTKTKEPEKPKPPEKPAPAKKGTQAISVKSSFSKTYGEKAFSLKAKLKKGNGSLQYTSGNPKVAAVGKNNGKVTIKGTGIAKITITATETSAYKKTSKTITVKVAPKKTVWKKIQSKSAKKVSLKWKAVTKASGYQIQYASNAKFKSPHSVRVTGSKSTTKTITKLKRKKIYYFRIRPYKKSGKTEVYGAFCKAKKVKVK